MQNNQRAQQQLMQQQHENDMVLKVSKGPPCTAALLHVPPWSAGGGASPRLTDCVGTGVVG